MKKSTRLKVSEKSFLDPLKLQSNYLFSLSSGKYHFVFLDNENHYTIFNHKCEALLVPSYLVDSLTRETRSKIHALTIFMDMIPDILDSSPKKSASHKEYPSKKNFKNRIKHFTDVYIYAKKIKKFLKLKKNYFTFQTQWEKL